VPIHDNCAVLQLCLSSFSTQPYVYIFMPLSNTRLAEEEAADTEARRKTQIRIAQNGGLVAIYFII